MDSASSFDSSTYLEWRQREREREKQWRQGERIQSKEVGRGGAWSHGC